MREKKNQNNEVALKIGCAVKERFIVCQSTSDARTEMWMTRGTAAIFRLLMQDVREF